MVAVRTAVLARFILLFGLLYAAFGVHSPFFPSFLSSRGLQPESIGLVLAVGTAIRLVGAPVAGRIADRFNAARAVLASSMLAAAFAAAGYLAAWGFWPLLLVGMVSSIALAPIAPIADAVALAAAARRGPDGRRAFDYGWVRGAGSAAFIAGSLVGGQAIERFGLTIIIALHAGLMALAALFAARAPHHEDRVEPGGLVAMHDRAPGESHGLRRLLALPPYRRVLLVAALVFGSHAMHDSFAVIRWREAGIGPSVVSLLWSESVAAEVLIFFLIGPRLLDRLGPARAAALCAGAGVVRWVVMAETAWLPAMMLVQPLHGLTFAFLHLACMRLLTQIVPPGLGATALTLYGTLGAGLSSVLLTLASGPLYGRFGAGGFWAMAILCAIATPVALTLTADARRSSE